MTARAKSRFSVNIYNNRLWRDRAARLLRRLAEKIDGRRAVAIAFESQPPLEGHVYRECVERGLRHANRYLWLSVREAAVEQELIEKHPELFLEEKRGA